MAPPDPPGPPARVGRYEVIAHLATGGMAQIYLARQTGLGSFERHVVLKTILRERASDARFVTMFLDEAKLAATLNHQNVAQVYEVDQADGAYFMAMEYVHGENTRAILETTLRRGWTIPLELAVMIIGGSAAGLHHAHERHGKNGQPLHIVHRDVSPANIMVGYDGSVKVLDFGIAKAEERATKTVGGTIKGKYGYMSPEQCKGKPIDRRSDIFALGICLYELTTLRRAFKGNDDFETMKRIVAGDVILPSLAVPNYPPELEAIVLTAMASDPGARFQTAQEMIEALDTFSQRAKLTGSNTAMARFMIQLFGNKREPWVDGAVASQTPERTEPSLVYADDDDDAKTNMVDLNQLRTSSPQIAAAVDKGRPTPAPTSDAAAWQGDDAGKKRQPSRASVQVPNHIPSRPSPSVPPVSRTTTPMAMKSAGPTLAGPPVAVARPQPTTPPFVPPFVPPTAQPMAQVPQLPMAQMTMQPEPATVQPPQPIGQVPQLPAAMYPQPGYASHAEYPVPSEMQLGYAAASPAPHDYLPRQDAPPPPDYPSAQDYLAMAQATAGGHAPGAHAAGDTPFEQMITGRPTPQPMSITLPPGDEFHSNTPLGSVPLIGEGGLGWDTRSNPSIPPVVAGRAGATRINSQSSLEPYRLTDRKTWLLVMILVLLVGVAGGFALWWFIL